MSKIITLSGSTKFKKDFRKIERELTLKGNVVISLALFKHSDNIKLTKKQLKILENVHYKKIDLCDILFVINKNKYIGISTKREIEYAIILGKKILFLEN